MRPEERDPAYLWDMLDAAQRARDYVGDRDLDTYLHDRMVQSAVERVVEIIGEAARRVSPTFKEDHPEIPWAQIIAQRNVLAHEYGDIDHSRMWALIVNHPPALIAKLEDVMPEPPLDE